MVMGIVREATIEAEYENDPVVSVFEYNSFVMGMVQYIDRKKYELCSFSRTKSRAGLFLGSRIHETRRLPRISVIGLHH